MEFTSFLFADAPPLSLDLRIRFSVLHFLEFAIWGAWYVVLANYLNRLNFSRNWIGWIYATIPIGAVIAPVFGGTIADRYFNAEMLMGSLHLVGALFLLWMAFIKKPGLFFIVTLLYALVYSPTLALSYSAVFAHLPDSNRDFPTIRVLGTIGWICAGLALKLFVRPGKPMNNSPLLLAAFFSLALGVFSFFLPATPPSNASTDSGEKSPSVQSTTPESASSPSSNSEAGNTEGESPGEALDREAAAADAKPMAETSQAEPTKLERAIPFLRALKMVFERDFGAFVGVSLLITIALSFYYSFTALYLEQHCKVQTDNVAPLMTIGQWVEIFFMFTLAWFIESLGMKWVLVIGMAAWRIRYAFFSIGRPFPLVILGIALHGVCFDFFFAAGAMYTENIAPADIKASAQSLFAVVTYGIGMLIGTVASGWLNQWLTTSRPAGEGKPDLRETNWTLFWAIPSIAVFICLGLFFFVFRG